MKPLLVAAGALSAMLALAATPASAADPSQGNPLAAPPQVADSPTTPPAASAAPPAKPLSQNEAAGLPDLDAINRTPTKNGSSSSNVEFSDQRTPSFHEKDRSGTEITEYRDHAKPTEIDVHSNFGTQYQMTSPTDDSPKMSNSGGPATGRVPSIHLTY
jgi:hypothetical protein